MGKWMKNSSKRLLTISVLLMLISMVMAGTLQSDFGKVTVKKIKVETDAGLTMGGLLYVPDSATEENPAPAAVVVHGWWKTKESQSSTAMELARRGIVALAIDMYGHGDSSNVKFNFVDSYNGLELLAALPYVDADRLGITGHSMGGKCCTAVTEWADQGGSVDVAAMVIAGTDPTYQDKDGAWINAFGSRDVCMIAARYDDFEYHGSTIHGPWYNAPRDYASTDRAKSFVNFGEDPANIKDEVQVGKVYEKEIDGRIAKRLLYTPTQIHSWFVLSPVSTGMTVSFLQDSLGAPNPLGASNQLGFIKELFTALGLVGMFMFMVSLVYVLIETPAFACLKASKKVEPLPAPKGRGLAWFWGAILVTAVVSYATLFPIATWVNTAPPDPLLPIIQAKSLGIWGVISGAVSLVIMYLNYRFYGKHNGIDLRERGIILPKGTFAKTVLLGIIAPLAAYGFVFLADYFFTTDFRFWTFAARAFESDKAIYTLVSLPLFLMYYIPNSLATNCFRYNRIGGREWINTLIVSVGNALGCIGLLAVQYITFAATGYSRWHDNGSVKSAIGWSYAVVAILIIAPIVARKIYKKTNNPYLAGIINGIIVAIISCTSTSTILYTVGTSYIPH